MSNITTAGGASVSRRRPTTSRGGRKATMTYALRGGQRYSPLDRAVFLAVNSGVSYLPSLQVLFHVFSADVVARSVQRLLRDDLIELIALERRLQHSPRVVQLAQAIYEINERGGNRLLGLVEGMPPGIYPLGDETPLHALLGQMDEGASDPQRGSLRNTVDIYIEVSDE